MSTAGNKLIEQVNEMLGSSVFLEIEELLRPASLFSLVGQTHTERWHSATIAWLLNPKANHGLDDFPMQRFLSSACIVAGYLENSISGLPTTTDVETSTICETAIMPDAYSSDYSGELTIKGQKKCSFDIAASVVMEPPTGNRRKLLLIIENKVKALEGKEQTKLYADWAWGSPPYPITDDKMPTGDAGTPKGGKYNYRVLVLLTPREDAKPSDKRFLPMSYQEFYDRVIKPCIMHPRLTDRGKLLLTEFCDTLADSDYARTERENKYAERFKSEYGKVINDMIDAAQYSSAAQIDKDNPENQGAKRVTLDDLYRSGLLLDGQELVYTRRKLNTKVTYIAPKDGSPSGGLRVEEDVRIFDTPSGTATHILGGQRCQGWNFFKLVNGDDHGRTLTDIRSFYREKEDEFRSKQPEVVSLETADYVDGVFKKHEETFQYIAQLLKDDGMSLPSRHQRAPKSYHDYSLLVKILGQGSKVRAFFKNHPELTCTIDLSGQPIFFVDGEEMTGSQATQVFARKANAQTKAQQYQWSQYWHIAEGKFKGQSFINAFRNVKQ